MNKKEFQKRIDKANAQLYKKGLLHWKPDDYSGVCTVLSKNLCLSARNDFNYFLKPYNRSKNSFWLGQTSKENIGRREVALRLFEQYVIDKQLYKGYLS